MNLPSCVFITTAILLCFVSRNVTALEEIEPNDEISTATFAKGATTITGSFETGKLDRDVFLLHPGLLVYSDLRIEARITSGPRANTEGFRVEVYPNGNDFSGVPASPTGMGYLSYDPSSNLSPDALPLLIAIESRSTTDGGDYEITVSLREIDKEKPRLSFQGRKLSSTGTYSLGIRAFEGLSLMKRVIVKAPGNRSGKIILRRSRVIKRNIASRVSRKPSSAYTFTYRFRRNSENMRVKVIAKDTAGNLSVKTTRLR